jgi:hypothetical protein
MWASNVDRRTSRESPYLLYNHDSEHLWGRGHTWKSRILFLLLFSLNPASRQSHSGTKAAVNGKIPTSPGDKCLWSQNFRGIPMWSSYSVFFILDHNERNSFLFITEQRY